MTASNLRARWRFIGMVRRYWIHWVLLGIVLLSLGAAIGYWLCVDYRQIDALQRDRLQWQARIVDENLGRQLEAMSQAMAGVRDEFVPWHGNRMEEDASRHLKFLANSIRGLRTIGIFDAKGMTLTSSRDELIGRDFSEREFFKIVRAHPDPDTLYVSPPFHTALGAFSINVTRAVVGAKGEFGGVVTTTLAPEYFSVLLASVLYAPGMRATLVHGDGKIILAEPITKDFAGADLAQLGSLYTQHVKSGQATNVLVGTAVITGETRMAAWRTIRPASLRMDKPLMIAVNQDVAVIFASWRRQAYILGVFYAALILITSLSLVYYQRRQMIRDRLDASYRAERDRVEEALREHDSRYRSVVETSSDGFWAVDREGRLLDANDAYARRSGYTREELLRMRILDFEAKEAAADISAHIETIVRKGFDVFETLHRAKDGTVWPVEITVRHRADHPGQFLCFLRDITERKRGEEERKRSAETLDAIMSQLTMVEEQERRVIAMDLHDDLSQLLAAANIRLRSLPKPDDSGDYRQSLREVAELVEQAERSARSLSFQVSPPLLFDLGLVPALESLAEELHKVYKLTATVNDDGKPKDLAPTVRSVLYRATRELLINVAKHAGVEVAQVDVRSNDGLLVISVTDSGVGFDKRLVEKHAPGAGFGLVSMRERLRLIGGQFDIDTHPGDGTVATLVVPLAASEIKWTFPEENIMTTAVLSRYEIDVEDIEYIRHGNQPLLARVYKPRGMGPFPLIIDLHGGAWCNKDRTSDAGMDEPLARSGVVVVALDFRMPPEAGYPASLADINYAIRWCKARAAELGSRPGLVGILGVSSGGHQAMLTAMRPRDSRYAALPLPVSAAIDATLRCVVLCWPVIDPLGRYQYAKTHKEGGDPKMMKLADNWLSCHDRYWPGEAAMAEGNPTLALARGEPVQMPPVLYLQGTADVAHPKPNRDQFILSYRKAGGRVELHLFDGVGEAFITNDPGAPASLDAIEKIIEFVHREIR